MIQHTELFPCRQNDLGPEGCAALTDVLAMLAALTSLNLECGSLSLGTYEIISLTWGILS
jgi:hypothetical protein